MFMDIAMRSYYRERLNDCISFEAVFSAIISGDASRRVD